jgi:hypothetical protein
LQPWCAPRSSMNPLPLATGSCEHLEPHNVQKGFSTFLIRGRTLTLEDWRYFEKISKVLYLTQKWKDFKNNCTTWKLVSIPFKWVPMLWGFNRVAKLPILFAFRFWWQK